MKKYAFRFHMEQKFSDAVTRHSFLLRCMPGTYPFQRSYAHKLTVTPYTALTYLGDVYGNGMYTGTIDKKHNTFSFTATGFVLCSKYLTHEPLDRLYLYPTALTRPVAGMLPAALPEDDWQRAKTLCGVVHQLMKPAEVSAHSTAAEAFEARSGDAKDFAQVLLAMCRKSGIAARFVSGLAVGISRDHAWVEVYAGGVWRALDPWSGSVVEEGYLKIAHGPDSKACAVDRGCWTGQPGALRTIGVEVTEHVVLTRDTVPHA